MQKIKIALLGLGGVGGYYGGKLAKKYEKNDEVEICFIARGEHLKAIREKGIHIITEKEDFYASPTFATNHPEEIGVCDYVIIATKSYDLKSSIEKLIPCIYEKTVIVPLLNGGNITEKVRKILPMNTVWSGLSYIVSRRTAPGEIRTSGSYHKMIFGCECMDDARLKMFENIMQKADIDAEWSTNVRESVWKKFYFISVTASLTSYFNVTFNELSKTEERREFALEFSREFLSVAEKEGIHFEKNALEDVVKRSQILPEGTTTSMHSDFQRGGKTEVETLTGEIVRLAHKHKLKVPLYEKVYESLKNKSESQ